MSVWHVGGGWRYKLPLQITSQHEYLVTNFLFFCRCVWTVSLYTDWITSYNTNYWVSGWSLTRLKNQINQFICMCVCVCMCYVHVCMCAHSSRRSLRSHVSLRYWQSTFRFYRNFLPKCIVGFVVKVFKTVKAFQEISVRVDSYFGVHTWLVWAWHKLSSSVLFPCSCWCNFHVSYVPAHSRTRMSSLEVKL